MKLLGNIYIIISFVASIVTSQEECGVRYVLHQNLARIAGGENVIENSWPWMVAFMHKDSEVPNYCGGAIINRQWIITAGHCVANVKERFIIRVGEHDSSQTSNIEEDFQFDCIDFHPKFIFGQQNHDIALVKLTKAVDYWAEVSPICLPFGEMSMHNLIGETITIIGWGRLGTGSGFPDILQELNLTVVDIKVCSDAYNDEGYPLGMTAENTLCATSGDDDKSPCDGDSGGPAMYYDRDSGTYSLAGVYSASGGCAVGFPGIFIPIRNAETLQWINDMAFGNTF